MESFEFRRETAKVGEKREKKRTFIQYCKATILKNSIKEKKSKTEQREDEQSLQQKEEETTIPTIVLQEEDSCEGFAWDLFEFEKQELQNSNFTAKRTLTSEKPKSVSFFDEEQLHLCNNTDNAKITFEQFFEEE